MNVHDILLFSDHRVPSLTYIYLIWAGVKKAEKHFSGKQIKCGVILNF